MKVLIVGKSPPISVDPNLVFVWDSKTGSITFILIAATIDCLISEASKFFP